MKTAKFDIADYLDSSEMIAEYLNTVLEAGDNAEIDTAIGHIAKAIGMQKKQGLGDPAYIKHCLTALNLNSQQ